jgi:hypothetical protein
MEISERLHRSLKRSFRILSVPVTLFRVAGFFTDLAKSSHQFQFGFYEVEAGFL